MACTATPSRAPEARLWTGRAIPEDIVASAFAHGPMRGDEVFTEEVATAIWRRDENCLVIAVAVDGDVPFPVGAALRDDRSPSVNWMVETAAPRSQPDLHHVVLKRVAEHVGRAATIRWRPPTSGPGEHYPTPPGSVRERTIVEMHAPLPLLGSRSHQPSQEFRFREFPGTEANEDERRRAADTVIRINNAAFADHPEQGQMSASSFARRTAAAWFDSDGLSIASVSGHDVGFVWMKCDPPRPAELHVVAVDPNAVVKGLGRALVHRGFAHATTEHGATEAMLFVDTSNTRAVGLYESLGFRAVRRQDVIRLANPEA